MEQTVAQISSDDVFITENLNICLVLPDDFPDESELIRNRIQNIFISPNTSTENEDPIGTDVSGGGSRNMYAGSGLVDTLYKIFKNDDNWDGYGTPKISEQLKQKCFEILEIIGKNRFGLPYVFPVCGGGIQFEWKAGNKELEIEFNENEISSLMTEKFEAGRCRYIEDENINLDQISELCLWLESL
jgi:hypothetical protein